MTRQEFERLRSLIEGETYTPKKTNPISVGLERCEFEMQRMERLLAAALTCDAVTVQRRVQIYQREIERLKKTRKRFEKLRAESEEAIFIWKKLRSTSVQ
jgi:hypothetical protein